MIPRTAETLVRELLSGFPIVTVTGPRQSGKTTLARAVMSDRPYRSLEDPDMRALALDDPRGFLSQCPDGAVLDEVQRAPDSFSYLQTRVDGDGRMGRFLLAGSQQFGLMSGISQSLAGDMACSPTLGSAIETGRVGGGLLCRCELWWMASSATAPNVDAQTQSPYY